MGKQIIFIVVLFIFTSSAFAQNNNVTEGISYLNITQNPDGAIGNITSTTDITRTTIAVIDTLQALSQTNTTLYNNNPIL